MESNPTPATADELRRLSKPIATSDLARIESALRRYRDALSGTQPDSCVEREASIILSGVPDLVAELKRLQGLCGCRHEDGEWLHVCEAHDRAFRDMEWERNQARHGLAAAIELIRECESGPVTGHMFASLRKRVEAAAGQEGEGE